MRVLRAAVVVLAVLWPATAGAVTMRDIIELTRAGLPDDVLIAVIDADRTVFTLDKDQILELKAAGVSKAVLLKMLRTRREFDTPAPLVVEEPQPVAPVPEVVVIGSQAPAPPAPAPVAIVVPQYAVPQYYVVPFSIWGTPSPHAPHVPRPAPAPVLPPEYRGFGRFINDGWIDRR